MENRFAARVRRRCFSEGEKRRPEMRLRFAGYYQLETLRFDKTGGYEHRNANINK